MKVDVKSLANKTVGSVDLAEEIFGQPYREHLIHKAVVSYQAAQRNGTHKVKGRSEVKASNRKPWRQKGTGRARAGTVASPLWRKGGIVHGPQPRSHADKLSRREKREALKSALSQKLRQQELIVLSNLELEGPKTRALVEALTGLGVEGKTLVVDRFDNRNLELASRNNPALKAVDALAVNVYDIVDRNHLVISEDGLKRLTEMLVS